MTKKQPIKKPNMPQSDDTLLRNIGSKLDAILIAFVHEMADSGLQIHLLQMSGFDWKETAKIVGMTVPSARTVYSTFKKRTSYKKRTESKKQTKK